MRMGHGQVLDHMFLDGLEDAYDKGRLMGTFAEECATSYAFTREAQDAFATTSLSRALAANQDGTFAWEIAPVTVSGRKGDVVVDHDEQPAKASPDKIPTLKPAFKKDGGTVTAANSSSISDGAAAVVMMRRSTAEARGLKPLALIVGHATHAQEPGLFTTAPVGAIRKLYEKTGWTTSDVDLFEINEAFAVVTMAAMKEHGIAHDKVNVHGGACALGHPIGASGARIVVTLLGALRKRNKTRGVAALCIGGGEATALAIERI
jgi:acetyl-CoA C-acetyltransferase